MTNLDEQTGLGIYEQRMKIEQIFPSLKSLLNLHKLMNKRRTLLEKMVALPLIAYALILGKTLRTHLYPQGCWKYLLFSAHSSFSNSSLPFLLPPFLRHTPFSLTAFFLSEFISEFQGEPEVQT